MRKLISLLALFLAACGGGGGEPSVSTNTAVETKQCTKLKTYSSSYPNSYLGSNIIPLPNQKFDLSIIRSIGLKDYHPADLSEDCNDRNLYARLLYTNTINRLKSLGVDTVEVYQYGPVDDFNAVTWTADESNWQIPRSELQWFFQEAHNKGLKVTLVWQLWPVDSKGNTLNTFNPSETETLKIIKGWNNIITAMAKVANEGKVDNLQLQWNAFYLPTVSVYKETSTLAFLDIINSVRNQFKGKLYMNTVGGLFFDKRIIEKVDAVIVPVGPPSNWSSIDDANMSLSLLKQRYRDLIDGIYLEFALNSGMDVKSIPIMWDINIQSRDKALSQGWVEDGFCIATLGGSPIAYESPNCMQINYITDFSVQALAIESLFQVIKEQNYFKTYGINFSTSYWHTDTIVPSAEGFPNFSQSIRGKPAENIVKYWFAR